MLIDTKKIAESREAHRATLNMEWRHTIALEQIADALEALRVQMVLINSSIDRIAAKP